MVKRNRNYKLYVQATNGDQILIEPPFTVEFDIVRNILSAANVGKLRIYNLSEKNRNQIRKDIFDYGLIKQVLFKAGYQNSLSTCFTGNISQAYSVREDVNFITEIACYDGGDAFANAITTMQVPAGTPQSSVIQSLTQSLSQFNVQQGVIGEIDGTTSRANSYSGSTTNILNQLTGGAFFIDNGKANVLGDAEFIDGEVPIINSQSGLLGTPIRETTYINFEMLFEPRLVIGQRLKLESNTGKNFNGYYKVVSLHHRGTISESVAGTAVTNVGLWAPKELTGVQ